MILTLYSTIIKQQVDRNIDQEIISTKNIAAKVAMGLKSVSFPFLVFSSNM